MAAQRTMDTAREERYFLCGPFPDVISRTVNECSAVEYSGVK
jgi:hypothetical protein